MILLMHVLSMLLCNGDFPPWNVEMALVASTDPPFTINDFLSFQTPVSDSELKLWKKKSCYKDTDGLWKSLDGRIAVPKIAYEPLFAYVHGLTHVNYKGIYEYIAKLFFTIGLEQQARNVVNRCLICARCNPDLKAARHEHLPPPGGPWHQLQIDFCHMPGFRGFSYMLVVVDIFSKWPEAFPARKENAQTVVKRLMEHIIPRFGISMAIDSDNGTPFTSRVTKLIAKAIGINATFHIPYHPQSSGQVECTNRTIKDKLIKVHKSKQMNWIEALPLVLMSMCAIPSRTTGLS